LCQSIRGLKYIEANLTSNIATRSIKDRDEQAQILLRFSKHGVTPTLNTDGGGVMGTTLRKEHEVAQGIIDRFKANEIDITEGSIKYYYSEIPALHNRDPRFDYQLIPKDRQDQFNMEQIKNETKMYREEVIPKIINTNH
jgi:hypothetical protein